MGKRLIILGSLPPNIFNNYKKFKTEGDRIESKEELIVTAGLYDEVLNYNRHKPTNDKLEEWIGGITTINGEYSYQPGDDIITVSTKKRMAVSGQDALINSFDDLVVWFVKAEVE